MTTLRQHLPLLGFGLALTIIYPVALFVAGTVPRVDRPGLLAAALTVDLTVLVPLLYYGLLVRRNRWPVITVAPVFLLSLLAASFVVPATHQGLLTTLKHLIAPAELLLLGYLGLTTARTARRFRTASGDVLERLRQSFRDVLHTPGIADVLAFETGLFYYALFSWRAPLPDSAKHVVFSYHKKNGYGTLLAGILVVMLIEMIALHTLLWLWIPGLAWVVTALSLYGILWLLGDWRAICLRPILVEKDALIVRIGLRWTVTVPFAAMAGVRPVQAQPPPSKTPGYVNALLLGTPQYLITLKNPIVAHGLYGMRKTITTLGLAVDDPTSFEATLRRRFANWTREEG